DLRIDVIPVLARVGDVHAEQPFFDPQPIDDFNGILSAQTFNNVIRVEEIVEDVTESDLNEAEIEFADDLAGMVGAGSPTPAIGVKLAAVVAMAIDPAEVEGREDTDGDLEGLGMLHSQVEGGESAHGNAC